MDSRRQTLRPKLQMDLCASACKEDTKTYLLAMKSPLQQPENTCSVINMLLLSVILKDEKKGRPSYPDIPVGLLLKKRNNKTRCSKLQKDINKKTV